MHQFNFNKQIKLLSKSGSIETTHLCSLLPTLCPTRYTIYLEYRHLQGMENNMTNTSTIMVPDVEGQDIHPHKIINKNIVGKKMPYPHFVY